MTIVLVRMNCTAEVPLVFEDVCCSSGGTPTSSQKCKSHLSISIALQSLSKYFSRLSLLNLSTLQPCKSKISSNPYGFFDFFIIHVTESAGIHTPKASGSLLTARAAPACSHLSPKSSSLNIVLNSLMAELFPIVSSL